MNCSGTSARARDRWRSNGFGPTRPAARWRSSGTAARVGRIGDNARRLGVPGLRIVHGEAPLALEPLPPPDAVFVGGGAGRATLTLAWSALLTGGRMVAHAVTQETEAELVDCWRRHGGELTRLSVEHLEPIGRFHGWQPARAVVQWSAGS